MKNSDLSLQLKLIISQHEGRAMAITARELSTRVKAPDRAVRLAILDLIEQGLPVLSATEHPAGYYLPLSRVEWQYYDKQLKNRIIEDAKRKAKIKKNVALYLLPAYQPRMKI